MSLLKGLWGSEGATGTFKAAKPSHGQEQEDLRKLTGSTRPDNGWHCSGVFRMIWEKESAAKGGKREKKKMGPKTVCPSICKHLYSSCRSQELRLQYLKHLPIIVKLAYQNHFGASILSWEGPIEVTACVCLRQGPWAYQNDISNPHRERRFGLFFFLGVNYKVWPESVQWLVR